MREKKTVLGWKLAIDRQEENHNTMVRGAIIGGTTVCCSALLFRSPNAFVVYTLHLTLNMPQKLAFLVSPF